MSWNSQSHRLFISKFSALSFLMYLTLLNLPEKPPLWVFFPDVNAIHSEPQTFMFREMR